MNLAKRIVLATTLLATTTVSTSCSRRVEKKPGFVAISISLPPLPEAYEHKTDGNWFASLFVEEATATSVALALKISDAAGKTFFSQNLNLTAPSIEIELSDGDYVAEAEVLAAAVVGGTTALCTTAGANEPKLASATKQAFKVTSEGADVTLQFASFELPTRLQKTFLKLTGDTSQIAGYTFLHNLSKQPLLNACASSDGSAHPYFFFPLSSAAGIGVARLPVFALSPLTLALVTTTGEFKAVSSFTDTTSATTTFATFNTQTQTLAAIGLETDDFDGDHVSNIDELNAGEDPMVADTTPPVVAIGTPNVSVVNSTMAAIFPITITGTTSIALTNSQIATSYTGTASCTVAVANGTSASPTVSFSACTGNGTVAFTIMQGAASDLSANQSAATTSSNTIAVDNAAPTPTLALANGDTCIATSSVALNATATAETGLSIAFEQAVSACPTTPTSPTWQSHAGGTVAFNVATTGGDGNKTLCAYTRDSFLNVSTAALLTVYVDTIVVAANLCAGTTTCGITGTRVCPTLVGMPGSVATGSQIFSGTQCLNRSANVIAGSLNTSGSLSANSAFSVSNYFSSVSNMPSASTYSAGRALGATYGTAIANPLDTPSLMQRDVVSAQVPQSQINNAALPTGYRLIPKISVDDDGYDASSPMSGAGNATNSRKVARNTSTGAEWSTGVPRKVCGKNATTIAAKIAECAAVHTIKPIWDAGIANKISWNGATKGLGGEGIWTLVTVYNPTLNNAADACGTSTNTCYEVWRDENTGLLWSDKLADLGTTTFNWCLASGNIEIDATCGTANQSVATSLCFEDTDGSATASTLNTPHTTADMKGNMHKGLRAKGGTASRVTPSAQVKWRLPSINDFSRAETHGIRFVLPNMAADSFWSASTTSYDRVGAWQFNGYYGIVSYTSRDYSTHYVRCVGGE